MSVTPTENSTEADGLDDSTYYGLYPLEEIYGQFWEIDAYLCLVTIFFGTLSFVLIPEWRNFRNFAFLTHRLGYFVDFMFSTDYTLVQMLLWDTSLVSMPLWLVFTAYSFYMNYVKIFSFHSSRIYLYASVCAWILPAAVVAAVYITNYYLLPHQERQARNGTDINELDSAEDEWVGYEGLHWTLIEYVEIAASIMNLLLYLRVLYVLVFPANIRSSNPSTACPRIRIATFIFVLSGVMTYMPMFIGYRISIKYTLVYLPDMLYLLQLFLSKILFLALKSHRTLWVEAIKRWCSEGILRIVPSPLLFTLYVKGKLELSVVLLLLTVIKILRTDFV